MLLQGSPSSSLMRKWIAWWLARRARPSAWRTLWVISKPKRSPSHSAQRTRAKELPLLLDYQPLLPRPCSRRQRRVLDPLRLRDHLDSPNHRLKIWRSRSVEPELPRLGCCRISDRAEVSKTGCLVATPPSVAKSSRRASLARAPIGVLLYLVPVRLVRGSTIALLFSSGFLLLNQAGQQIHTENRYPRSRNRGQLHGLRRHRASRCTERVGTKLHGHILSSSTT
jgi:hypothetical protein